MRVLAAGVTEAIGSLCDELQWAGHTVTATSHDSSRPSCLAQQVPWTQSGSAAAGLLLAGVEVLLVSPEVTSTGWLDRCTCSVYQLLSAAAASSSVRKVVLLSTMDLFLAYHPSFSVTAAWQPQPQADDHAQLGHHLAEFICHEFARSTSVEFVIARLGCLNQLAPQARFWVDPISARQSLMMIATSDAPTQSDQPGAGRASARDHRSCNTVHLLDPSCEDGSAAAALAGACSVAAPSPPPSDEEMLQRLDRELDPGRCRAMQQEPTAFSENEKVLLLGSNGQMGVFVSEELERAGHSVTRADYNRPSWNLDMPWGGNAHAKTAKAAKAAAQQAGTGAGTPAAALLQPTELQDDSEWAWTKLDVSDAAAVLEAATASSMMVNLSVNRRDHGLAFAVNTIGTYHSRARALSALCHASASVGA